MKKEEIQDLIKDLVEKTTIPVKEISINEEVSSDGTKAVWFSVELANPYIFINRNGEGLFALNHLVKRIVESKVMGALNTEDRSISKALGFDILIDINGFQKKKKESIHAIAHMMAERARYFKSNIEIDPMSSFERRIVHEYLSNETDLKTESSGEGMNRRVVIKYTGSI